MTPVVDVHHHMFPPVLTAALAAAGIDSLGGEPLPPWSPEASLAIMDRYGIDRALLSAPVPLHVAAPGERADLARAVNDFGAECARRWPDRFGFFAALPLPDVPAAVAEAGRALDDLGAAGVGLLTNHAGVYPGDPRLDPLYAELDRRGAVAFVHPTVAVGSAVPRGSDGSPVAGLQPSLLEFAFETARAVADLLVTGAVDRFAGVRHVVTHCGGCAPAVAHRMIDRRPLVEAWTAALGRGGPPSIEATEAMMAAAERLAAARFARLYVDVALSAEPHVLDALTALVPPDHLLLGTDYPMAQEIGVHVTLSGLDHYAGLTPSERAAVRSTNAAALWAMSDGPRPSAPPTVMRR